MGLERLGGGARFAEDEQARDVAVKAVNHLSAFAAAMQTPDALVTSRKGAGATIHCMACECAENAEPARYVRNTTTSGDHVFPPNRARRSGMPPPRSGRQSDACLYRS